MYAMYIELLLCKILDLFGKCPPRLCWDICVLLTKFSVTVRHNRGGITEIRRLISSFKAWMVVSFVDINFWLKKTEKKVQDVKSHDPGGQFSSPRRVHGQGMSHAVMPLIHVMCGKWHRPVGTTCLRDPFHPFEARKMGCHVLLSKHNRKTGDNSNFSLLTCLLKLCKATCCATHCGSSDTSATSASQNWSTKVYANQPTTNQALKGEIRRCISVIPPQLCQTVTENSVKITQVSQQSGGGQLPDVLCHA